MRSFLLEDDPVHAAHFADSLDGSGIRVDHFSSPAAFFEALALATPDIIVLDWMLPGESGYQVLRQLRGRLGQAIPVLMLTCVDSEAMVIDALEAGADDFLTKPVARGLLRARLQALARRAGAGRATVMRSVELGPYRADHARQTLHVGAERLALTPLEFDIAWLLLNNADRFVRKDELIAGVWGKAASVAPHTLAQHIHALRKKLRLAEHGLRLVAIYGSGYRLESPAGDPGAQGEVQ